MRRIFSAALVASLVAVTPGAAVAAGDAAKGKTLFAQCMACHKIDASGASTIGPNLYGIVGRPIAAAKGFKYSPAMTAAAKKGKWTPAALDAYLASPAKAIPGNRMPYAGMAKPADRANLIAYMASVK